MREHFPLTAKQDGMRMSRGKAMLCPHLFNHINTKL